MHAPNRTFSCSLIAATVLLAACAGDGVESSRSDVQRPDASNDAGGDGGGPDAGTGADREPQVTFEPADTEPDVPSRGGDPSPDPDPDPSTPAGSLAPCPPIDAKSLPARRAILDGSGGADGPAETARWFRRDDLCALFSSPNTCGACHWGKDDPLGAEGVFQVTCDSIDAWPALADEAFRRIWSEDPNEVMPPGSDASQLSPDSEIALLGEMLRAWDAQGQSDLFMLELGDTEETSTPEDAYSLDAELGDALTNLGSCTPSAQLPRLEDEMRDKDAMFKAMGGFEGLPRTLYGTDMVSLDSQVLAQHGVYSYAPTYTLFSDHAAKMRYVRVPVGETIRYDPDTQDFEIPENTRFYKTFLKEVVDADGHRGWRKMETRIIVSRRDRDLEGGGVEIRAIRASYAWDREERVATLVTDPLRDQTPFSDRLCPYIVDETGNRDTNGDGVVDKDDSNPVRNSPNCTYMDADELADPASGTVRHYAIPSRTRCDECHMGSSNRRYILGFTPWHADRRAEGEGGTFDAPPTDDELSQLERLVDYGVVSGIEPGEAKLEDSQGERQPRNDHELKAQGYMMGNCAFCHNDNGFPTRQNPTLAPFNLFPNRESGGVFQFPLERYSPRASHVTDSEVRALPYITSAFGSSFPGLVQRGIGGESKKRPAPSVPVVIEQGGDQSPLSSFGPDYYNQAFYQLGPWRSLIWRNTYTPFTYEDQNALFIHMPRNVPGFDVRAHRIMASWMLSIPSRPKADVVAAPEKADEPDFAWLWGAQLPQPVEEVAEGDEDYADAKAAAEARVEAFAASVTGTHEPPDEDIVAPEVLNSAARRTASGTLVVNTPAPVDDSALHSVRVSTTLLEPENVSAREAAHSDGVPSQAHWVVADTTDLPGVWQPRRGNWRELLVSVKSEFADAAFQRTLDHIKTIRLTSEQEAFSLEPVPLGLWSERCDGDRVAELGAETVEAYQSRGAGAMRNWLAQADARLSPEAYVHTQSRGQAVFTAICQNCHGTQADSKSPLATTILELTGGTTRVANFVDGLFGPRAVPGYYADREFFVSGSNASPDEWHARYMLFMALGGTEKEIPRSVLRMVAVAPFYGRAQRTGDIALTGGANMLLAAEQACRTALRPTSFGFNWELTGRGWEPSGSVRPFLPDTGHYELWESLCAFDNEPLVRIFQLQNSGDIIVRDAVYRSRDDAGNPVYPNGAMVGDQYGNLTRGIQPGNTTPWCLIPAPSIGQPDDWVDPTPTRMTALGYSDVPWCPDALFETRYGPDPQYAQEIHRFPLSADAKLLNGRFAERWYRRGAMNAGLAAYYFLDRWTRGETFPAPAFDADTCRTEDP